MRFIVFVEGFTEQRVVGPFLKRWLDARTERSTGITPVRFDGWSEMIRDMPKKAKMYLNAPGRDDIVGVLAILDLYGPTFYPSHLDNSEERLEWARDHVEQKIGDSRFRVFFAVHELEAWLLSQPEVFPVEVAEPVRKLAGAPEKVDFDKPPSKRLSELYQARMGRRYKKTTDGVQLFSKLDPVVAASKCPELRNMLETMLKMIQDL